MLAAEHHHAAFLEFLECALTELEGEIEVLAQPGDVGVRVIVEANDQPCGRRGERDSGALGEALDQLAASITADDDGQSSGRLGQWSGVLGGGE